MPDVEQPSITAARIAAIVSGSTSAALGLLKLTGGTMSGAIAMGGSKITGAGAADTNGDLVRYQQVKIERAAVPAAADWTLEGTPTNVTITKALADLVDGQGVWFAATSSVAGPRILTYYRTGTSIRARCRMFSFSGGTVSGGPAVSVRRASDGKKIALYNGSFGTYMGSGLHPWTDRNTQGTPINNRVGVFCQDNYWIGMTKTAANTYKTERSMDGQTWVDGQTGINVTTQIGAGDPDTVEIGVVLADASAITAVCFDRIEVS